MLDANKKDHAAYTTINDFSKYQFYEDYTYMFIYSCQELESSYEAPYHHGSTVELQVHINH